MNTLITTIMATLNVITAVVVTVLCCRSHVDGIVNIGMI
jgi:hypothetical protein